MWNGEAIWLFGWLLLWAAADIWKRSVSLGPILLTILLGVVWRLCRGALLTWGTAGGLAMGGLFCLFARLSAGRFGEGDALVILCLGLYLGLWESLAVVTGALFLSSAAALYLLLVRKQPSRTAIPFLPFLTVSFLLLRVI